MSDTDTDPSVIFEVFFEKKKKKEKILGYMDPKWDTGAGIHYITLTEVKLYLFYIYFTSLKSVYSTNKT